MANGWTPERRRRQAEVIRRWKPWERSSGPKTEGGKARVARNAYRGGVPLTAPIGAADEQAAQDAGRMLRALSHQMVAGGGFVRSHTANLRPAA